MRLYHRGIVEIEYPEILENQRLVDFGMGFYTTSVLKQAEDWAKIKAKRENSTAVVSEYEFSDEIFESKIFKILSFENADEKWLDFILKNRRENIKHGYDLVKGAVADDSLYATIRLFETGILTKNETILRLKAHKLFDQISFHSKEILDKLKFIKSTKII